MHKKMKYNQDELESKNWKYKRHLKRYPEDKLKVQNLMS